MRSVSLALLLPLQACILYDGDCPGGGACWDDSGDADTGGDGPGPDDSGLPDDDTGHEPPPWAFVLMPAEAEAGETFIASLRFEGEAAPACEDVASVEFFGDVEILAQDVRSWEVLLALAIPAEAPAGTADVLVRFQGATAAWGEDVLAIWPAASGHEAGPSDDGSDPCDE